MAEIRPKNRGCGLLYFSFKLSMEWQTNIKMGGYHTRRFLLHFVS